MIFLYPSYNANQFIFLIFYCKKINFVIFLMCNYNMKADLHNYSFLSDGALSIEYIVKKQIKEIAEKYDLIMTGGTDFHGYYSNNPNPFGSFTCPEGEVEKLIKYK